jgi:diaminopimelate epimerase
MISFTKMHGLGNDFIVFEIAADQPLPTIATWRALANRHTGIGFDQALVISAARSVGTDAYYRIFNADGGEVEQCGNGARCVAEWLRRKGRARDGLRLESPGGIVQASFPKAGQVAIDMGEPRFAASGEASLLLDTQQVSYTEVSMGNPHIVLRTDNVDTAPVATLGPRLESHPAFPARTNVGFLQVLDAKHARLRVYERGVGETRACGTGACAAMATGRRAGWFDESVTVTLPGGSLQISWNGPGSHLWMSGPAAVAFEGFVEV